MKSKTIKKDKKSKLSKLTKVALPDSQKPAAKLPKKLRKWIESQNQIALQQTMSFEPELAKIAQQTIEQYHPDLVWDVSGPVPLGRVIANSIPEGPVPDSVVMGTNSKLAQALVVGITDHVQKAVEDVLLAALTPLIYKYGPVIVKRALKNLDDAIVDYILEKQIHQKQQAILEIQKQASHLEKWKQTPTPSE